MLWEKRVGDKNDKYSATCVDVHVDIRVRYAWTATS